jgi:hypothetical protein
VKSEWWAEQEESSLGALKKTKKENYDILKQLEVEKVRRSKEFFIAFYNFPS